MSAIDNKYAQLGGPSGFLGKPTSPETALLTVPFGSYRHYEHGSIYWNSLSGAYEVHGLIQAKWAALGWEKSFLGYPKSDESDSGNGAKGRYNMFQFGAITWKSGAKEAFEQHGEIRSKYCQLGCEAGVLGFATTDETLTPDLKGRYNHFENGSIYWKSTISAHEVHGPIHQYWSNNGWEKNPDLGYPISDVLPAHPGSNSFFSDFENGVVYVKEGLTNATSLLKFTIADASETAAQVIAEINKAIVKALTSNPRVYITSGPTFTGVSDYHWDGATVHNRLYQVHVEIGLDISGVPDPSSVFDFGIEIHFDRTKGTIWAALHNWHVDTFVPWPTSWGVTADTINNDYHKVLDPLIGAPQNSKTVPAGFHLLSAKVMLNGDLNIYMQPLLDK
ncbi:MAG: hypothetical protein HKK67_00005 [Chlorobiaceae bacterium]|nr:hypothetical protein [Chlorobiaceae bacterium]